MSKAKLPKGTATGIRKHLPKTVAEWGVVVSHGLQVSATAVAILAILQGAATPDAALAVLIGKLGEDVVKKHFADFVDRLKGKEKLTLEAIAKRVAEAVKEDNLDLKPLLDETQAAVLMLKEAADQNQVEVLAVIVNSRDAVLDAILASNADLKVFIAEILSQPKRLPTLHTLREPVPDFTGRDDEIAELVAALTAPDDCNAALISAIHGMGGVGKTELARKVCQQIKTQYPDAGFEIDCQPTGTAQSPDELMATVIRHFDREYRSPGTLQELRRDYLGALHAKRGLLLLDNARDGGQMAPLLPPPAGWAVIVTSRETFPLDGGCMVDLNVLPPEKAIALVRGILQTGKRAAEDADVAKLTELCGRLPLALRIAADFLVIYKDWTVAEYLKALEKERPKYLDVPGKQNVFASLGISVRQLEMDNPELALRWRLLGVFPAPFDRRAASVVWGKSITSADELPEEMPQEQRAQLAEALAARGFLIEVISEDETRDSLSELRRRSMVDWDDAKQEYSLHDLLREYALMPPLPEGWDGARRRHAAYYLGVGAEANGMYLEGGDKMIEGLRRFDAAWLHLQSAWEWMKAQGDDAAARWVSDFAGRTSSVLALRLTPRHRTPFLEAAMDAAKHLGDKQSQGIHVGNLGISYAYRSDPKEAVEFYDQALIIAREIGDRQGEAASLVNLGSAYADMGDPPKVIEFCEQALAVAREVGDRRVESAALGSLGLAYADLGDPETAIRFYRQSLLIAREVGDRRGEGKILGLMGLAAADLGQPKKAIDYYEEWLAITQGIGDRHGEGQALGNIGNAYAALGDPKRAIGFHEQALTIARDIDDREGAGTALGCLASAYEGLREINKAIPHYVQALEIAEQIEDRRSGAIHSWNLGLLLEQQGDFARAAELMQVRVDYLRSIGHPDAEKRAARVEEVRKKAGRG